jgi:hypothetical protein
MPAKLGRPLATDSIYYPLHVFLLDRLEPQELTVSFEQIESILGFNLPSSARKHKAWWGNQRSGHSHSRAWLLAGWRVDEVDVSAEWVHFIASDPGAPI